MFKEALTYDDIQIVPKYSEIVTRTDCNLKTRFTRNYYINKPYVAAPMDTVTEYDMAFGISQFGGVGCVHRFMGVYEQVKIIEKMVMNSVLPRCASIGINDIERAEALIGAGVNILLIDVAHGNTSQVRDTIKKLKKIIIDEQASGNNVDIIAGNVSTSDGALNLCEWGVDAIRVGIGNGSLCETRIRTGIGIPQVTAIIDCVSIADEYDIPVIADGGVRMIGDVAKALALGADSVMLGSLLAGTKESPGVISKTGMFPNEQLYKRYRGSASLETKMEHNLSDKNIEGNSKLIPYKGKIKRILSDIDDGLRSSMSYVNSINLEEFRANSEFVKVTQNGMIEAKPHLL